MLGHRFSGQITAFAVGLETVKNATMHQHNPVRHRPVAHFYPAAAWAVPTCGIILGRRGRDVTRIRRNRTSIDGMWDNRRYPALLFRGADHLIVSEKPLASFLARLAALFSIKVFMGFFLFCFLLSLPLLMLATPYDRV